MERPHTGTAVLLTVENVAAILQVSPDWVRDHATRKQPRLPVIRVGKLLRFRSQEIDRWIQEQALRAC
jgi:excisionase family DNA binding protein